MMTRLAFVVLFGSASVAAATEYPWSAIARQCGEYAAEQLHRSTGAAGAPDTWTLAAHCAANNYYQGTIAEPVVKTCINRVWAERWRARACASCRNPIDQTFFCLSKP